MSQPARTGVLAKRAGIHSITLRRWRRVDPDFPAGVWYGPNDWRCDPEAFDRYLELRQQRVKPAAQSVAAG